jgi:diguanylate cyclase (GGDEF)-like protein
MTLRRKLALAESLRSTDDGLRLDMLQGSGALDPLPCPDFDRWTAALRRNAGASIAALCFRDASSLLLRSVSTRDPSCDQVSRLPFGASLERYLLGVPCPVGSSNAAHVYAEVPVTVDDQVLGRIAMADHGRTEWAESDIEALGDAARAVSTELALRLAKKEAERVQQLVSSHKAVHDLIAEGAPLREILVEVLEAIERCDPSLKPSLLMLDPISRTLHSALGPSLPPEYLAAIDGVVIGPQIGTCGSAAWFGRLTVTADIAEDPKWTPIRDKAREAGLAHCWSMPMKTSGGEVLGTLAFYGSRPRSPQPEHLALLADWARIAGIAIERRQALDRLIHDARHDGLTGLPNRSAIFETLDEAIRRLGPDDLTAVMFIDLDELKNLNDTLGHDRADEMLREMGERLSSAVRPHDFVGRFGGDEFVVIVEKLEGSEEATLLGLRLLEAVSQPLPDVDSTVVTASIGITLVRSNTMDARELIQASDAAMYDAKRAGRDRLAFFKGGERARTGRRLVVARELNGAEMRGELRLVFQPVFALPASEIVSVEALLRWTSPTLGEVSPSEFVPIAEDTGAIVPIGAWVLRESCEAIARMSGSGRPLEVDVNVSTRQVSNPDFALWVRQTLAHAELPADQLGLEITETSLMRPNAVATRNLHELDALGVRIVLDDFGTGYSSLSWLKQHPFSAIKIDRSFIGGLAESGDDEAIVAAVITMAKALGCTATAEGVETKQQLAILNRLDCQRAQGFLLAKPMSESELAVLLTTTNQWPVGAVNAA